MLPTTPYPLALYKKELGVRREANCGYYHLVNVAKDHPIYNGLAETPMICEVYKRGVRKQLISRPVEVCLHNAVDWMMDMVGVQVYDILDQMSGSVAASVCMELLIDGDDFAGLPASAPADHDVRMDIYANLIARFAVAYAPRRSKEAMEMLTSRCQVPYRAHVKSIEVHNHLAPMMASRIQ